MFSNGDGVEQDYAEAVRLHRLAAAQGHADAQGNLGLMFQHGRGVAKNRAEAIRWYRLAAAQGDAVAAATLRRLMCTRPSVEVASRGSLLPRVSYRIRAKFIKSYYSLTRTKYTDF